VDKQTATGQGLEGIEEPQGANAAPEAAAEREANRLASASQDGYQEQHMAALRADEDTFAVEEPVVQESGALPIAAESGESLELIRKMALWVTLALFIVLPSTITLGLLVIALALHIGRLMQIVRAMTLEQWGYVGVTLLGGVLRFWDLALKPMHHDESMHAYFSWLLSQNPASYQYDPLLHGPFQFHAIAYVYYVASNLGVSDHGVNDVTARTAAALLGAAMIPMCYFLRGRMGKAGALVAAFLLAVSPIFVYYSRFTREDIYFVSFTFATVVAFFKFCEQGRLRWLLMCVGAFVFAYTVKEAAFFNIAMFGGILGGFIAWELGSRYIYPAARIRAEAEDAAEEADGGAEEENEAERAWSRPVLPLGLNEHAGVPAVLLYLILAGVLAKVVLGKVQQLSAYLSAIDLSNNPNPQYVAKVAQDRLNQASGTVQNIEDVLVNVLLLALVLVAVVVLAVVIWQLFHDSSMELPAAPIRRGLARWIDPVRQPLLNGLVRIPWSYWFFALLVAFVIFAGLFWIVPAAADPACANGVGPGYHLQYTYIDGTVYAGPSGTVCSWSQGFHAGIGDGLVQGIFYWITQQQYARGGQPWYYYLILIPFYEQLIVVFGLAGLVRCLARPNRFRLFVAIWFLASIFLYSWAGEKMPWLSLHILLPLLLLAAIALDWVFMAVLGLLDEMAQNRLAGRPMLSIPRPLVGRSAGALFSLAGGFLLLIPMLHSMLFVTYVDPGEAPHEMLSYVQTTPDVTYVLSKMAALDQQLYHGQHLLKIGVDGNNEWPFAWYLRDYQCVGYGYNDQNPAATVSCNGQGSYTPDVLLIDPSYTQTFTTSDPANPHPVYKAKEYRLRAWWDEGYKPSSSYGVGFWLWMSYGDSPPKGATFNAGKAFGNFWAWLWTRKPIGSADGSTDFMFLVRSDLPMNP
jgi:predicted membrane-bound mannosyltransferase